MVNREGHGQSGRPKQANTLNRQASIGRPLPSLGPGREYRHRPLGERGLVGSGFSAFADPGSRNWVDHGTGFHSRSLVLSQLRSIWNWLDVCVVGLWRFYVCDILNGWRAINNRCC